MNSFLAGFLCGLASWMVPYLLRWFLDVHHYARQDRLDVDSPERRRMLL